MREALDLGRRYLGPSHPDVAETLGALSDLYFRKGDYAAAEKAGSDSLEILRRTFPQGDLSVAAARAHLSLILISEGKPSRAEPPLREALSTYRRAPDKAILVPFIAGTLGECLTRLGRYAEAEPLLTRSYDLFKTRNGERHPDTIMARRRLTALFEVWHKPVTAPRYAQ